MNVGVGRRIRRDDWTNAHSLPILDLPLEKYLTINERKKGEVPTHPNIVAWLELCSTLANQDIPATDNLAAKTLDPKPL